MKRLSALLIPLTLALGACDTEEQVARNGELTDAPVTMEQASPDPEKEAHPHGDHHGFHGPGKMINRLCHKVGCTEEQYGALEDLARDLRPDGPPDFAGHKEARKALADAFRADTLDAATLDTHAEAFRKGGDAMKSTMADALVGVHAILTPEQRGEMAEIIEKRGAHFLGGRGGRGHHGQGKRGPDGHKVSRGGEADDARRPDVASRGQHMVQRLCEKVSCTEEQATELRDLVAREASQREPGAMREAKKGLAAAFRADDFGPEQVREHMAAAEEAMKARMDRHRATMVQVHDILTPEQREIVAETIETRGPRALMGGGGHRGRHHRK